MPSTVASLLAAANVERHGVVRWGERIPRSSTGPGTGIYMVALTDDPETLDAAVTTCPLSDAAVQELLAVRRKELKLDGRRPDAAQLAARLAGFWCPDEVVQYGGRAGPRQRISVSELSDRVAEYYTTPLGARSPHAGGWPLKTLSNLSELHVHYSYCDDYTTAEKRVLDHFAEQLSEETRDALHDSTSVMPFANLEDGHGHRKRHGIKGTRAPRKTKAQRITPQPATPRGRPVSSKPSTVPSGTVVSAPELARRLDVSPMTLRAWLRSRAHAGHALVAGHEHYGRWWLTEAEARQLADEYRQRR